MSRTQRTIDSTPRDMYEAESFQRFSEGLKLAVSCAREMNALEPKAGWNDVANSLRALLVSGKKLSEAKALTRQALLADAARIQGKLDTSLKNA